MERARSIFFIANLIAVFACNGFVGEVELSKPEGPPIAIVKPDYVVLRPVTQEPAVHARAATVDGQTVYFTEADRVLDLRHLDPRTARIDRGPDETYVVWVGTTDEGDQLLGDWTAANVAKQLGVFLDGRLISAPVIRSKITGGVILNGRFSKEQAELLIARLKRGGAAV